MRRLLIPLLCLLLASGLLAQKRKPKKDVEPKPQALEVLPEPPDAVTVETGRLMFLVSPLSSEGLLSRQVREALKAVLRSSHGASIVKIKAYVAGSGDLRRIKEIVADEFTDHRLALPAVSTVQVGALPMVGAQVLIEVVAVEKKIVNPNGLAFVAASDAREPIAKLQGSLSGAGVKPADVLRLTCFLSSLEDAQSLRAAAAAAFPAAAANFVQMQRLGLEPQIQCAAVGRLASAPASPVVIQNGTALVNAPKLVFTATQLVFRDQDADFRLAYQRLGKALASQGAAMKDVAWTESYALTKPNAAKLDAVEHELLGQPHAGTTLQIEGLPSTDATAAVELIAVSSSIK
jgi:enamine deaminase RidA (YjgF/YER057c/UK114 family)